MYFYVLKGRWLDKSTKDTDPKKELDKALFNRMQDLLKKKREFQKEKIAHQEAVVSFFGSILHPHCRTSCFQHRELSLQSS